MIKPAARESRMMLTKFTVPKNTILSLIHWSLVVYLFPIELMYLFNILPRISIMEAAIALANIGCDRVCRLYPLFTNSIPNFMRQFFKFHMTKLLLDKNLPFRFGDRVGGEVLGSI